MPPQEEGVSPQTSSEQSTPSVETSSPSVSDTAPSSSPPSEPTTETSGSSKDTLLDAVLKVVPSTTETDVLAETKETASPETPDDEKPEDGQAETPPAEDDDEAEVAAEAATPAMRKKFNKLLRQRRELRAEVETLKPKAEIGGQLEGFAQQNDLSGEDVANVLRMAAMLRHGDYASFYKAISPFVRSAQEYLGIALPKAVREKVQQGQMSEEMAKEYVRQQMDHKRLADTRETEQKVFTQRTIQSVQNNVASSVNAFEQRLAANDPDYKAKAASVRRTAQAMLFERGGTIENVEQALQITKAAYDEVNSTIRKQRPPPQATSRQPNGNGQTRSARPEPTSLMEAALQGLANARNGAGHP